MFLLWRKRRTFILLSDRILSNEGRDARVAEQGETGEEALFAAFEEALLEARGRSRRKLRIAVRASDTLAAIVALPWQAELARTSEIDRYAEAQFERTGQVIDGDWVMFSYFRHYGAHGMAYAFRKNFIRRLQEIASSHEVVIDSIVPLSVFAYTRQRQARRGTRALLLREPSRNTALVIGRNGLLAYATEPVTGNRERSVERLLRRLRGDHELEGVEDVVWQTDDLDLSASAARVFVPVPCAIGAVNFWRL